MATLETSVSTSPLGHNPAAARVVGHVEALIARGRVRPGDRLPPERELALHVGVSRPSVRAGLRWLTAMGVVRARQGSGTFITDGPPRIEPDSLGMLATLHRFSRDEMFEARRVLEVGIAGLAAERATAEQLAAMGDEVAGLFASIERRSPLMHDVAFTGRWRPRPATPCSGPSWSSCPCSCTIAAA
jgi:GntR family transcriptional repressor for pyruvate dehydrogenase complex